VYPVRPPQDYTFSPGNDYHLPIIPLALHQAHNFLGLSNSYPKMDLPAAADSSPTSSVATYLKAVY